MNRMLISILTVLILLVVGCSKEDSKQKDSEIGVLEEGEIAIEGENAAETTEEIEKVEDDAHSELVSEGDYEHGDPTDVSGVFNETSGTEAVVDYLTLTKPENIEKAYNPASSTDFLGSFADDRVYIMGHKGQLYHYNLDTEQPYTYDNLVEDAAVDSETGNLIYTKFNEGQDPALSIYKVMKEYPDPIKVMETTNRLELQELVFYKDTFITNFYNLDTGKIEVYAFGGSLDSLSEFGSTLNKNLTSPYSGFSTDGNRLIAYDHDRNAVVDLSSGNPSVIKKFSKPVFQIMTGIQGDTIVISGSDKLGESYFTMVNDKKIAETNYHTIHFYDDRSAFINDGMQLQLLDTKTSVITPLGPIVADFSVTGNHVYYVNISGEVQKIEVQKAS